jgi:hypothetical protein
MILPDLDHFRARLLQDALTEATAQYWVHVRTSSGKLRHARMTSTGAPRRGS